MVDHPAANDVSALMQVLEAHWVMTLALGAAGADPAEIAPYPTPLFYALAPASRPPRMIFASSPRAHHSGPIEAGGAGGHPAAAAIYLESEEVGELRGAQLRGRARRVPQTRLEAARGTYLGRHPVAAPVLERGAHALYEFEVHWAKLTDNRLGFGVHPVFEFAGSPVESESTGPSTP